MTTPQPIRCEARHPTVEGWKCRAKLTVAVPGTVQLQATTEPVPPGCVELVCERCGARYVACARAA